MTGRPKFNPDAIPEALKALPNWVGWAYGELRPNGKRAKPPVDIQGRKIDPTNPANWLEFNEAVAALQEEGGSFDGIGFALAADDQLVCIDLDDCVDDAGRPNAEAQAILDQFSCYTERSPSGKGFHIWLRAELDKSFRKGLVEVYSADRYITMTGQRYSKATTIKPRQRELDRLVARLGGADKGTQEVSAPAQPGDHTGIVLDNGPLTAADEALIERIRASDNGPKFDALMKGDLSSHNGDQSAVDQSLCSTLARPCKGDTAQMCRIFGVSQLAARSKWQDRPDYQQRTIYKAQHDKDGKPIFTTGVNPPPGSHPVVNLPEDIEPLDIAWCLRNPAPKKAFHAWPYIPAGCVGVLTGTGSVGKSYLTLALCAGVACGHSFGPFEIEQPRRVTIVNVEDPENDLHFRLIPVVDSLYLSFDEQQLLKQNLRILPARGKLGPLMQLDERRNPQPSASYAWLREEVKSFQPDLLVLDTKSRLFGLDENSNDHAAQWLVALERLLVDRPELSILIISHNSKAAATTGDTSQHATRGASSLVDNSRFTLTLTGVDDSEAKKLGGKAGDFVRLVHAKPNYTRRAEPALFRRGDKGELHPVSLEQLRGARISEAVEQLRAILLEEFPDGIRARELERCLTEEAKRLRDWCLDGSGLTAGDWPEVIRFGIESLRLEEVVDEASKSNNKPTLIKAKTVVSTGKSLTGVNWQETLFAS